MTMLQNDDSATGAGDIGEQLDAENYYNIIHSFYSRKLTSASSEVLCLQFL